jgi:hypothetical protein
VRAACLASPTRPLPASRRSSQSGPQQTTAASRPEAAPPAAAAAAGRSVARGTGCARRGPTHTTVRERICAGRAMQGCAGLRRTVLNHAGLCNEYALMHPEQG